MSGGVWFAGYFPKMCRWIILWQNTLSLTYRFYSGWSFTWENMTGLFASCLMSHQGCKRYDVGISAANIITNTCANVCRKSNKETEKHNVWLCKENFLPTPTQQDAWQSCKTTNCTPSLFITRGSCCKLQDYVLMQQRLSGRLEQTKIKTLTR